MEIEDLARGWLVEHKEVLQGSDTVSITFHENKNIICKEKVTGGGGDDGEGVNNLFCLKAVEVKAQEFFCNDE